MQSLCGSEVTRKIKQLALDGARAPVSLLATLMVRGRCDPMKSDAL